MMTDRTLKQILVALLCLFLGACAPTLQKEAAQEPAPEPQIEEQQAGEKQVEGMLEDGRRGFIIAEPGQLSADLARRFDEAVELLSAGQTAAAVERLEDVVAAEPQLSAPYINLGLAFLQLKRTEEAEKMLLKALELVPGHPVAGQAYGLLLRRAGRFNEAQDIYLSALQFYPDYLPLRRNLAVLCDLYLNNRDCALEHFEYYLSLQPQNKEIELWVNELRLRH